MIALLKALIPIRNLTAIEKRLVGTWSFQVIGDESAIRYFEWKSDGTVRFYVDSVVSSGSWRVENGQLVLEVHAPRIINKFDILSIEDRSMAIVSANKSSKSSPTLILKRSRDSFDQMLENAKSKNEEREER